MTKWQRWATALMNYAEDNGHLPASLSEIEMTPDGAEYLSLGESGEPSFEHGWPVLRRIFEDAEAPLTVQQLQGMGRLSYNMLNIHRPQNIL